MFFYRKLAIVVIVLILNWNVLLKTLLILLILFLSFFFMHYSKNPFVSDKLQELESLSMGTLIMILLLVLMKACLIDMIFKSFMEYLILIFNLVFYFLIIKGIMAFQIKLVLKKKEIKFLEKISTKLLPSIFILKY